MTTSIADPENSAPSDYQESALDMDAVAKLSSRMINHKFPNCKLQRLKGDSYYNLDVSHLKDIVPATVHNDQNPYE